MPEVLVVPTQAGEVSAGTGASPLPTARILGVALQQDSLPGYGKTCCSSKSVQFCNMLKIQCRPCDSPKKMHLIGHGTCYLSVTFGCLQSFMKASFHRLHTLKDLGPTYSNLSQTNFPNSFLSKLICFRST